MKRLAFHSIWPAETGERFLFSALCSVAVLSKLRAEGILEVKCNHFHLKSSWKVVWNVQPPIPFDRLKRANDFYVAHCAMSAVLSKLQVGRAFRSGTQSFPLKILMESGMKRSPSNEEQKSSMVCRPTKISGSPLNRPPPALLVVLQKRAKPYDTSHTSRRWYGLPHAKDGYLLPVNGSR